VLCLLTSSVWADDTHPLHRAADAKRLGAHREWHTLLHVKHGRSEIDDPAFFFAADGKHNPRAELHASLHALLNDTSNTDDSVYCRYPSRSQWLIAQLPEIRHNVRLPDCHGLQKERALLDARSVTLILAAAHINSPASAFGHTFLRIDSSLNSPLAAYAVNYAAKTAETNGFIYAYQGLFGGYEGRYSLSLYAEKVKEYSDLEHRDIWEYTLNLTDEEITRLVNHIFEIRHVYADYYFTSENCSYNLLWLLQVARPGFDLTGEFGWAAIPVDTVRAVENAGFVQPDKITYRPSVRQRMVGLANYLSRAESHQFVKSADYDVTAINHLPVREQISALELATLELRRKRSYQEIDHERYTQDLIGLLKVRSRFGEQLHVEIETPDEPGQGHFSSRLNIGAHYRQQQTQQGKDAIRFGGKLAYHDIYDHDAGFLPGAYISFFDAQFIAQQQQIKLDSLSFLDIRSYAVRDVFFKPVSWQVTLGVRRLFEERQHGFLRTGAGLALGGKKLYGYMMVAPALYSSRTLFWGGALQAGLMGASGNIKYGAQASQEYFSGSRSQQVMELFATLSLSRKWALNARVEHHKLSGQPHANTFVLQTFYYF
jgi:hypothetical protein